MTRFKSLFAAAVASAIVAVAPAASAQTFHFVGAGSSAQFTMAAVATDEAACIMTGQPGACSSTGGTSTILHWTAKNAAQAADNRDSLNRILPEVGNISIVWLQNGGGTITDVWAVLSVDSTVGVRTFSAVQPSGVQGAYLQIVVPANTPSGDAVGPANGSLWPDNTADVALPANVLAAFGGEVTSGQAGVNVGPQINVGLTDIRPEDAAAATKRSMTALNTTTWAGLGYVGPTADIGAGIFTDQGTGTVATPIQFGLSGKEDPISKKTVAAYTTIPIGAAPVVFIYNNAGDASYPIDAVTGVTPDAHETGQTYPLADLFNGTTACTNLNPAFDAFYTGATPAARNITVFLREPLSGTMNTTEFSLFRSDGQDAANLYNSQEVGVINPTRSPYNPLGLACKSGGTRERAIGTGEVVGKAATYGVLGNAGSLGYIFWGFSNAGKLAGTSFNYLTLDGVDPIGLPATLTGNGKQNLPNCTTATCPATLWTGSNTFPNLRNGTYKAWSIYRWLAVPGTDSNPADPYGPIGVAQLAQDYVDLDVTDFVPFQACPSFDTAAVCSGNTNYDGLSVYHSHFTQTNPASNGSATTASGNFGGNTLGTQVDQNGAVTGTAESGGDEGGLIEGPFGITAPYAGYVEWHNATALHDDATVAEVQWKQGAKFAAGAGWVGCTINLGNPNSPTYSQTIAGCPEKGVNKCNPTTTTLYVGGANPAATETIEVPYTVSCGGTVQEQTYPAATAPGVTAKKQ
jgi:hypothetical protein